MRLSFPGITVDIEPLAASGRPAERDAVDKLASRNFPGAHIEHDPDGAPRLAGIDGVHISISHGAGFAVLSWGNVAHGIDIEAPREQLRRVARRFVAPGEEAGSLTSLLSLWTAKEAVYKAARTPGLSLTDIVVSADLAMTGERSYRLYYSAVAGAMLCVAVALDRVK